MSNRVLIVSLSIALVLFAVPVQFTLAACWTTETVTEPARYCAPCDEESGCGGGTMWTQISWKKCAVAHSNVSGMSECENRGMDSNEVVRVGYAYICTQSYSPAAIVGVIGAGGVCLFACLFVETGVGVPGCVACVMAWEGYTLHGGICGISTPCAKDDDYKSAIYKAIPELGGNACQIGG